MIQGWFNDDSRMIQEGLSLMVDGILDWFNKIKMQICRKEIAKKKKKHGRPNRLMYYKHFCYDFWFSIHCFRVLSTIFSLLLHLVLIPSLSPLVLLSYGSWERVLSGTVNVHMKNKTPFHTIKGAHPIIGGPHVMSI